MDVSSSQGNMKLLKCEVWQIKINIIVKICVRIEKYMEKLKILKSKMHIYFDTVIPI